MSSRYLFISLLPTCLIGSADSYPESEFRKHHSQPIEEVRTVDTGAVLYAVEVPPPSPPEEEEQDTQGVTIPKLTYRQKENLKRGWASIETKEKVALEQLVKDR